MKKNIVGLSSLWSNWVYNLFQSIDIINCYFVIDFIDKEFDINISLLDITLFRVSKTEYVNIKNIKDIHDVFAIEILNFYFYINFNFNK
jgi:hypothetical protein